MPGVPAGLLDTIRQEAVGHLASLMPPPKELTTDLVAKDGNTALIVNASGQGRLRVRWLVDGQLPWHVRGQAVPAGRCRLELAATGQVNRCIVEFTDGAGRVLVGTPLRIPQIRVDSVQAPYSQRPLNDGIRAPAASCSTT